MAIRIFLLMGINWLFETISSIVDFQKHPSLSTVETIFDIINASQGKKCSLYNKIHLSN